MEKCWNAGFLARVFGAVFVVTGVIGFIPNPICSHGGLFETNAAHNLVHVLTGLALLIGASLGEPLLTIRVIAALYAVVALAGFLTSGDLLLGIVRINDADRWLHAMLAAAFITIGALLPKPERRSPAHA